MIDADGTTKNLSFKEFSSTDEFVTLTHLQTRNRRLAAVIFKV